MKLRKGWFIALLLAGGAHADPVGMFTDVKDVGVVSRATEASFESSTGTYTIGASGDNIWAERDAFGYAWKPTNGDVAFAARIEIQGTSAQEHRKAGLMFRQTLEPDSAYVDVVIHGNGLTSLQFRTEAGGPTREIQCAKQAPNAVRLTKRGDYVLLEMSDINGKFEPSGCSIKLAFRGVYYAGLAVCAHDNKAFETALFRHVSLGLLPKRSEIRTSAIEIIPLGSLDRRVIYRTQARLDSPSFTGAGNAVCFREDGRLLYYSLTANTEPRLVGAENADECDLAHPITASPLLVSHEVKGKQAQIVRRDTRDGKPTRLTSDAYSNWTPRLSPTGESMVLISGTAPPDNGKPIAGDYLLREMPVHGGEPRELARFYGGPGALGPAPWSTDGKQVVFVSREPE
jgi:regulation of enolase protein 1 (concanavalin A-like superfamily)